MKATELMVGDLIQFSAEHSSPLRQKKVQVFGVKYSKDLSEYLLDIVFCDSGAIQYNYNKDIFSGIQLTPEILEKNGFVNKKGRFMQFGNFDNPPLVMWHLVDDKILGHPRSQLEIHSGAESMHVSFVCNYVHQLQHALRLCKIDKEIKLED